MLSDCLCKTWQWGRASGQHDVIYAVVRRAGEEELQGATNLLGHAVNKRTKDRRLIVFWQITATFFALGFFHREPILTNNQLSKLGATEGLVSVIENLFVPDHLHAGRQGSHFEKGHHRIHTFIRQRFNEAPSGQS